MQLLGSLGNTPAFHKNVDGGCCVVKYSADWLLGICAGIRRYLSNHKLFNISRACRRIKFGTQFLNLFTNEISRTACLGILLSCASNLVKIV